MPNIVTFLKNKMLPQLAHAEDFTFRTAEWAQVSLSSKHGNFQ